MLAVSFVKFCGGTKVLNPACYLFTPMAYELLVACYRSPGVQLLGLAGTGEETWTYVVQKILSILVEHFE